MHNPGFAYCKCQDIPDLHAYDIYIYICVCVCVYIYIYIYIYAQTAVYLGTVFTVVGLFPREYLDQQNAEGVDVRLCKHKHVKQLIASSCPFHSLRCCCGIQYVVEACLSCFKRKYTFAYHMYVYIYIHKNIFTCMYIYIYIYINICM